MKIKINVPYRNGFWAVIGCLLMMAFLGPLTVTFVREEMYGGVLVCVVLAWILLRGTWVRLNYGLRINEKCIVLRSQRQKHVIPYDAVREMVVTFRGATIAARIITTEAEEIGCVWEEIQTDSQKVFPGRGWGSNSVPIRVGIRMTYRFVEKCIERLSQCEKVRVENFYQADR